MDQGGLGEDLSRFIASVRSLESTVEKCLRPPGRSGGGVIVSSEVSNCDIEPDKC